MLKEKKARQESDHIVGAELCCSIVSQLVVEKFLSQLLDVKLILG